MAAGQLAGGLAWLAISGEDAPDLVATAPVPASFITGAKIEAVMGVIAMVFAPLVVALAVASPRPRLVAAAGSSRAGGGHRDPVLVPQPGQAQPFPPPPGLLALRHLRGGVFLDRLGGAAAVAAVSVWLATAPAVLALMVLAGAWFVSPRTRNARYYRAAAASRGRDSLDAVIPGVL